jgi:threonine/homoserine/homoserine lactone efflux protein
VSDWLLPFASIAAANLLGAMSPGPAFVLILRTAMAHGRRAAWRPIAGLALGATIWTAAALWGLQALFTLLPWLQRSLPAAGGAFLVWFGLRIWRGAAAPPPGLSGDPGPRAGFGHALALQLANPKVMVFFGSLFMAVLPPHPPPLAQAAILAMIAVNEFAWYAVVAAVFGSAPARTVYGRAKAWIDRAMAILLLGLGLRLAWGALAG